MKVLDPCPDTLLARARAGAVGASERAQLREHLARCEACRVSYQVGQDFDRMLAARSNDTLLLARVVDVVSRAPARPLHAVRRARALAMGILAAALALSAVAVASVAVVTARTRRARETKIVDTAAVTPSGAAGLHARSAVMPEFRELGEGAPSGASGVTSPVGAAVSAPVDPSVAGTGAASGIAAPPSRRRSSAGSVDDEAGPDALFAEANARRRAGDDAAAQRTYMALESRFPTSAEAQVSRVALGRLLLEKGVDPVGALAQFDAFLARTSESGLVEEALFGRATALMQLGRFDEERQTWQTLLDRFPGSVYAERARARLRGAR